MKDRYNTPDAIIAGAPKCGTTSVFEWLSDHPEVCASSVKETYFLMDRESPLFDSRHNYHELGLQGYDRFFPDCANGANLRLEATPDYLYQQTPLHALREAGKRIKAVFLLRKPSERAYSAYKFFSGHKSIFDQSLTFAEYIDHVKNEHRPTEHHLWPLVRNTIKYGEYARYLKRWAEVLGQENIIIYLYEDLCEDPRGLVVDIAEKLNIDSSFYDDYDYVVHNRSYSVKSISLHRLKDKVAALLPNSSFKRSLGRVYKSINVGAFKSERTDDDLDTLRLLDAHYQQFNALLASQFGIPLDKWK